jgi:hypothetical protein
LVLDKHEIGDSTSKLSPELEVGLATVLMGDAPQANDIFVFANRFQHSGGVKRGGSTRIHDLSQGRTPASRTPRGLISNGRQFAVAEGLKSTRQQFGDV